MTRRQRGGLTETGTPTKASLQMEFRNYVMCMVMFLIKPSLIRSLNILQEGTKGFAGSSSA
ncbi:hypothetical protein M8C21_020550 [Ambrosia artemisiifolia]|uniref:Uncharacterized protein n=1 Tax=Ambrosia artemisiifolia TaxID=4212 RepID=A0AAD5CCW5_AMBAR|nr:hypothetical protein M8C21_020550 [Ambrosia artemisiifolia]